MPRNSAKNLSILAIGLLLAACKGSGVDNTLGSAQSVDQTASGGLAGNQVVGLPQADAVQDLRAYCPKTVMRAGTEKIDIFPHEKKRGEAPALDQLQFRATITDVARECNYAGQFLNMKVGAAGRVISGPSRATGTVTLPLRIAITQGETVVYSQLHEVVTTIEPGRSSANFSFVDTAISFPKPQSENIVVYVGFDEQRTDAAGEKKQQKPIN